MNTRLTPNRRTRLTFAGVIATLAASLALIISGMSGGHIPDTEAHAVTTTVKTTKQKQKRANKANRTVAKRVRKAKAQARKAERKAQLKQRNLYIAMRDLWYQHMEWTYATVTAFVSDSPGLEPTMNRLLKNQDDGISLTVVSAATEDTRTIEDPGSHRRDRVLAPEKV